MIGFSQYPRIGHFSRLQQLQAGSSLGVYLPKVLYCMTVLLISCFCTAVPELYIIFIEDTI